MYGDQDKFGKQVGGDILADKKTFLLITALSQADASQMRLLTQFQKEAVYSPEQKIREVTEVYDQLNIRVQTETKINHYFTEAIQNLDAVNAPQERKALLKNLALKLMEREK